LTQKMPQSIVLQQSLVALHDRDVTLRTRRRDERVQRFDVGPKIVPENRSSPRASRTSAASPSPPFLKSTGFGRHQDLHACRNRDHVAAFTARSTSRSQAGSTPGTARTPSRRSRS
jgi:hypothetical protein